LQNHGNTDSSYVGEDPRSEQDYKGCRNEAETNADNRQQHCEPTHSRDGRKVARYNVGRPRMVEKDK
jgi:hypothetical protein